jgi:hypothetical protein
MAQERLTVNGQKSYEKHLWKKRFTVVALLFHA